MPEAVLGIALLAWALVPPVVCVMKGKWEPALWGLFIPFVGLVCAIRLAKPSSWWARRRYSDYEMARARTRFPADAKAVDASTRFKVEGDEEEMTRIMMPGGTGGLAPGSLPPNPQDSQPRRIKIWPSKLTRRGIRR